MRPSIRLASWLALGLIISACREPTTRDGQQPRDEEEQGLELALPDPLPLPEHPKAASWIAQPSAAVAMIAPYSPVAIDLRAGAEYMLAQLTERALAAELARAIDLRSPFANVILDDGQEVVRLSLSAEARSSLAGRLSELEPRGEFGAVRLPTPQQPASDGKPRRAPTREWLAWIDEADGSTLVLANSLEGLVTGRTLARAYGHEPVFFTIDPSRLPLPIEVPFARVTGRGDLSALEIEAQALTDQDPFADFPIAPGTLGGLLSASQISAGASSRYANHDKTVRELIITVNSQVAQLPFLLRSFGQDLAAKLATTLRTWDGRVLAATGPSKHVRLAYGASDVEKSRVAALRLLQTVVDNVSLARNFSSQVPRMSLRRRVAKGGGIDVELFVLHDAASLARELRPLVDNDGRLNVAMAWSQRAGGGMLVLGPRAADELARWLDETKDAVDHASTAAQLLAASFAAEPEQLRPLLEDPNIGVEQLLGLSSSGPKWQLSVTDQGAGNYLFGLVTPGPPKPARARSK